ncbi:MAG: hypothetical protein AAF571_07040 [Verrucomicrobiota bacterium]
MADHTLYVLKSSDSVQTALVISLVDPSPASMPEQVIGDDRTFEMIIIGEDGSVAAESTAASYLAAIAIGTPGDATLQCYQSTFTTTANGREFTLDMKTAALATALGSSQSITLTFEYEIEDPSGDKRTLLQIPVVVRNEIIDPASITPTPAEDYLTEAQTDNRYVAKADKATQAEVEVNPPVVADKWIDGLRLGQFWTWIKTQAHTWSSNQVFNGTNNTLPNQAADSDASAMTRILSDDRYFSGPNVIVQHFNNFTGAVVGGNSSGQSSQILNASGQSVANSISESFMKCGIFPALAGSRSTYDFSKQQRVKIHCSFSAAPGDVSDTRIYYIIGVATGYDSGEPTTKSYGIVNNAGTIRGFTHDGTTYRETSTEVSAVNNNNYFATIHNNGSGFYSFTINGGSETDLGSIDGPTGTQSIQYTIGANTSSTTADNANSYYILKTLEIATRL